MKALRAGLVAPRTFELIEIDLNPEPDEILVEVAACGICSSEIPRYDGSWVDETPSFFGHEASGIVADVGSSVEHFKPGDHVTGEIRTGFATHGIAKEDRLVHVPADIPLSYALGEP